MKKTLFFIALAALCTNVFAQDYLPMLQEGHTWNVVFTDGFTGNKNTATYFVEGETTINGIVYKTIQWENSSSICYAREENGVVYMYDPEDEIERVALDFSLEIDGIGDISEMANFCMVTGHWNGIFSDFIVSDVTTQFIAGADRKVLEISLDNFGTLVFDQYWIEGLGSTRGGPTYGWWDPDSRSDLSCFTDTDGVSYMFNDFTECIVLNAEDFQLNEIVLYPNPISDSSTLQFSQAGMVDTIKIFDVTGRLVKQIPVHSDKVTIRRSHYAAGMYFYQAFLDDKLLGSAQFIVTD